MTRTLSCLFFFPRGPSRILPRTNFATKQAHLCSSVRASSSSNENDDIHRIFRQKFISDDDDAQLFECAKTFSARDFTDIISEYNPDILGRKKKNQPKLGKGISGRALSSFNIVLSAFLENERYAEIERVFSIWQEEFERLEPDLVSVSLVVTALHRTHDIANVERFISEQKSRLIKRPNKKVSKKKINVNKYERDNVLPMDIVFEDNDIIALNKTSGVPSTSDPAMPSVSEFVMAMKKDDSFFSLSEMNGMDARGLVHRLDKLTSGVIVLAKNNVAHCELVSNFYRRKTKKVYNAIVNGICSDEQGEIDFPVDNREAYSKYAVLERLERGSASLVEILQRTGRKHQIRAHLAHIGHPLVNDVMYSPKKIQKMAEKSMVVQPHSSAFFLHARSLELPHPSNASKMLKFEAPLPALFLAELDRMR